jgi:hypothetical protein
VKCPNCEEEFKPKDLEANGLQHDCVGLLKENLKASRQEIE